MHLNSARAGSRNVWRNLAESMPQSITGWNRQKYIETLRKPHPVAFSGLGGNRNFFQDQWNSFMSTGSVPPRLKRMLERKWVVGPFQCNCRLLACPRTGEAALVDPGDDPEQILRGLEGLKTPSGAPLQVKYLLHTHGHLDHIGAAREVKQRLAAPKIALHRADEPLYQQLQMQGALFGINYQPPCRWIIFSSTKKSSKLGISGFRSFTRRGIARAAYA